MNLFYLINIFIVISIISLASGISLESGEFENEGLLLSGIKRINKRQISDGSGDELEEKSSQNECTQSGKDELILDCSEKKLTALPDNLEKDAHSLLFNNNNLKELTDQTFPFMDKLKILEIQNNQISLIAENAFDGLPSIESIDLRENPLQEEKITMESFNKLSNLKKIYLPIKISDKLKKQICTDHKDMEICDDSCEKCVESENLKENDADVEEADTDTIGFGSDETEPSDDQEENDTDAKKADTDNAGFEADETEPKDNQEENDKNAKKADTESHGVKADETNPNNKKEENDTDVKVANTNNTGVKAEDTDVKEANTNNTGVKAEVTDPKDNQENDTKPKEEDIKPTGVNVEVTDSKNDPIDTKKDDSDINSEKNNETQPKADSVDTPVLEKTETKDDDSDNKETKDVDSDAKNQDTADPKGTETKSADQSDVTKLQDTANENEQGISDVTAKGDDKNQEEPSEIHEDEVGQVKRTNLGQPANQDSENEAKSDDTISQGPSTSTVTTRGVNGPAIGIIIGIIIVMVAGILIKKNWSTIKNKFNGSQGEPARVDNIRTIPEEVPLNKTSNHPV